MSLDIQRHLIAAGGALSALRLRRQIGAAGFSYPAWRAARRRLRQAGRLVVTGARSATIYRFVEAPP